MEGMSDVFTKKVRPRPKAAKSHKKIKMDQS